MEPKKCTRRSFCFSPTIRTITNLFKPTNLRITYKTANTIQHLLQYTPHQHKTEHERSGIYRLTCNTCNLRYIGQTNRNLQQRYKEHNDPQSAYAVHILNNRHEYGTLTDTMKLLQHISNPTTLLSSEQLFIQSHHHHKQLIPEQHIHDINPLYQTILDVYDTSLTHRNKNQYHTRPVLPQTLYQQDVS